MYICIFNYVNYSLINTTHQILTYHVLYNNIGQKIKFNLQTITIIINNNNNYFINHLFTLYLFTNLM